MAASNIVVLGAGVTGLTTALLLARNTNHNITVIAKHMPGDYDVEYASPWAGANYLPVSLRGTEAADWDRETFKELWGLVNEVPEAGIHKQEAVIYYRERDAHSVTANWLLESFSADPWFKDVVPNFRVLPKTSLPAGFDSGTAFLSVCINTAIYLPYLVSQCLKLGVTFKRAVISHISEAYNYHSSCKYADLVVNCSGLLACKLGGVEDQKVIPARGQIVLVRNTAPRMYTVSGADEGGDELMYIMTRAAGGGTILGGSYQLNNWDGNVDPNLAVRIMKRCVDICPELVGPGQGIEGLDIIRHGVGLRPLRLGGPRLEKEVINHNGEDLNVVHYYGVSSYGYQSSYGMAQKAVKLVEEVLATELKASYYHMPLTPTSKSTFQQRISPVQQPYIPPHGHGYASVSPPITRSSSVVAVDIHGPEAGIAISHPQMTPRGIPPQSPSSPTSGTLSSVFARKQPKKVIIKDPHTFTVKSFVKRDQASPDEAKGKSAEQKRLEMQEQVRLRLEAAKAEAEREAAEKERFEKGQEEREPEGKWSEDETM